MIDGRQNHEIETTPKKCAPEIKFVTLIYARPKDSIGSSCFVAISSEK